MSARRGDPIDRSEAMDPLDHLHHRGESSPRWRSSVVTIEILDRVPEWQTLQQAMERTTRTVPRLRQKVVAPWLPTTGPRWVIDSHFDLGYHLRRVHLPAPGGLRELLDMAEISAQSAFDPARPLWTMALIEGFEGDKAALMVHHSYAVTDGIAGMLTLHDLYDDRRDAPPRPMPREPKATELGPTDLTRDSLAGLPGTALSAAKSLVGGAAVALNRLSQDPFVVVTSTQKYVGSIRRLAGPSKLPASPALNHRSLRSRTAAVDIDMSDLRAAATRSGTSVNDAFLSTLAGALRIYHEAARRPVERVSMSVPVDMRTTLDRNATRPTTGLTIAAPLAAADPGDRMRQIHRKLATGQVEPALGVLDSLAPLMTPLPDSVLEAVSELRPVADVQARHLRGPRHEQYVAGAQVMRAYTLCPKHRVAVMAALTTRGGRGTITTRYDTAAVIHQEAWDEALIHAVAETVAFGRGDAIPEPVVTSVPEKPRARRARRPGAAAPVEATTPDSPETVAGAPEAAERFDIEPTVLETDVPTPVGSDAAGDTDPAITEPAITEPAVTEPEAAEPEVMEPEATGPEATQRAAAEPEAIQSALETEADGETDMGGLVGGGTVADPADPPLEIPSSDGPEAFDTEVDEPARVAEVVDVAGDEPAGPPEPNPQSEAGIGREGAPADVEPAPSASGSTSAARRPPRAPRKRPPRPPRIDPS